MTKDELDVTRIYRGTKIKLSALEDIYGVASNPKMIDLAVDYLMKHKPTLTDERRDFVAQDVIYKDTSAESTGR